MLEQILASVQRHLNSRSRASWQSEIEARLAQLSHSERGRFCEAIAAPGETLICEIKRKSPSTNGTPLAVDVAATARLYQDAGASAISVLTEPDFFSGSLADMHSVIQATSVSVLRKDFILDELQILEAKAYGASAVLLIVAALQPDRLSALHIYAQTIGLDTIVEVHDRDELQRALEVQPAIIGVNNRYLKTLAIDLAVGECLLQEIPAGILKIAESGIASRQDILRLRDAGADAFLIGTSIMRSVDVAAKIKELRGL